jgi:type III secretory pathway component EscV
MKRNNYGLYAIAGAIVVVGALWVGVPLGTLATLALILVCPLMMFFMMRGMHGGPGGHGGARREDDESGRHDHQNLHQ